MSGRKTLRVLGFDVTPTERRMAREKLASKENVDLDSYLLSSAGETLIQEIREELLEVYGGKLVS